MAPPSGRSSVARVPHSLQSPSYLEQEHTASAVPPCEDPAATQSIPPTPPALANAGAAPSHPASDAVELGYPDADVAGDHLGHFRQPTRHERRAERGSEVGVAALVERVLLRLVYPLVGGNGPWWWWWFGWGCGEAARRTGARFGLQSSAVRFARGRTRAPPPESACTFKCSLVVWRIEMRNMW